MPDVLFGWSQFHASRAFVMLPSLDLYGAPRGTSNVADLRVMRYPSNDEVRTYQDLSAIELPADPTSSGDVLRRVPTCLLYVLLCNPLM